MPFIKNDPTNQLMKALSIYTFSSGVGALSSILLIPFMTNLLSLEQYGLLITVSTLITIFSPVLNWGSVAIIPVVFTELDSEDFKKYFASILWVPLTFFIVCQFVFLLLGDFISIRWGIPSAWLNLIPLIVTLGFFPQVYGEILRMQNRPYEVTKIEISILSLNLALTYLFIGILGLGWQGRIIAIAIANLVASLIIILKMHRMGYLNMFFSGKVAREVFSFGLGLVPHDLSNSLLRVADRLVLVSIAGSAALAKYGVAMQVSACLLIFLAAFNKTWAPFMFNQIKIDTVQSKRIIVITAYKSIVMMLCILSAFLVLYKMVFIRFVNYNFYEAISYIPYIAIGYFFMGIYMIYIDIVFYFKKTYILSLITIFNLLINVGLNIVLVKRYGPIGASFAFLITMFLVASFAFIITYRLYPLPWTLGKKNER